ncbi:helix-turn-helix domain-containing protein [Candidatus Poribacteria bacterium]|nr:helix-turn-helix domain-containing protein [Candidatus Poribacteria bacterium]
MEIHRRDNKLDEIIGHLIRKAREEAGLRQTKLAGKLGISQASLSQYESGERKIPFDILQRTGELTGKDSLRYFNDLPVDVPMQEVICAKNEKDNPDVVIYLVNLQSEFLHSRSIGWELKKENHENFSAYDVLGGDFDVIIVQRNVDDENFSADLARYLEYSGNITNFAGKHVFQKTGKNEDNAIHFFTFIDICVVKLFSLHKTGKQLTKYLEGIYDSITNKTEELTKKLDLGNIMLTQAIKKSPQGHWCIETFCPDQVRCTELIMGLSKHFNEINVGARTRTYPVMHKMVYEG